jgi:hypothetical protein
MRTFIAAALALSTLCMAAAAAAQRSQPAQIPMTATSQTPPGVKNAGAGVKVDIARFEIGPVSLLVPEGSTFKISVMRSDAAGTASVDYATQPSPALVQKSGSVKFASGEQVKEVTFPTVADAAVTGDVSAQVKWSNPVNSVIRDGQAVTFATVTDNDQATIHRCRVPSLSVDESAGVARIELERTGAIGLASTGTVTIAPVAGASSWRRPTGTWSVAFEPKQAAAFVEIPVENNDLFDGHQSVTATCGGFVDPSVKTTGSVLKLAVTDDERPPAIRMLPDFPALVEGESTQTVKLWLSLTTGYASPAVIHVEAEDGSAGAADYKLKTKVVQVERGVRTVPVEVEVTGDDAKEDDEQFTVMLSGALTGKVTVKILDDDLPLFDFDEQQSATAVESAASVTLRRSDRRFAPLQALLRFEPVAGHGGWPADDAVSFHPGQRTTVVPLAADDQWYTGDRTVRMTLFWPGVGAAEPAAELTLLEDDPQPVVSILDATVREGAAGETTKVLVTILLSAPLGVDLDVRAATAHGTAGADDYTPFGLRRVSIAPGQLAATVPVEIRGDDVHEEDETLTLTITGCCDPAVAAGELKATITIRDDDAAIPPPRRRRSVGH